jgi:hypothetical protein
MTKRIGNNVRKCKICNEFTVQPLVCKPCDRAYRRRFGYRQDVDLNWEFHFEAFWAANRAQKAEKKRGDYALNYNYPSD